PTALGALDGTVAEAHTGAPVAGATVELSNAQGSYAMAVAGADGRFHAPLERGMYTYTTTAADRGSAQGSVDLASTASASADVRLGDTGRYALKIVDDAGHPSPARVRIAKSDGSGVGFFLSGDGGGGDVLPPGDYRAVFSRGYEWEAATVPFTVVAGQTVEVDATLSHVVDTRGWVALDSHTHTAISVDSQLDPRQRVRQALADGVELVVATDHDVLFDLGAVESDMNGGLAGAFATTIGTEISPVPGHINGYPVAPTAMADGSGYWPVRWWTEDAQHVFIEDVWPPAIFAGLRAKLGAEVVQINHPRSGQGLLNWVGYDPAAGLAAMDPSRFDMGWDAIEVCNAGCSADPSSDDAHALADWYSFLDQGYRKTAVGVSDAHGDGNFLGRARTMVAVLNDDPATLDREEAFAALKAGQAVVLDGAFVTATVRDDAGAQVPLGGLATATGATVTLHVHVEAPSWIPTDHLRVIANGSVVQEQPLPSKGVVRFDGDLAVAGLARDAWLVVIVDGDSPMAPVIDGNPRTITNAILVDRDGNGRFDPPRPAM
ncbi:MAG TPA: CehA/McbA family metallohydrolase, partial [Polyangiaceae bacterium]|nr:CehA/McbA family metallohydrolase [Polyangiaceae bacterium]